MKKFALLMLVMCMLLSACHGNTEEQTATAKDSQPAYSAFSFSGYDEFSAFLEEGTEEAPIHNNLIAYIQTVKEKPETLLVPYYAEEPVTLANNGGGAAITLHQTELYGFLWAWFHTRVGSERVTIRLSKLSEEHGKLADGISCPELIAAIAPTAPNVDNYTQNEAYSRVFADEAEIGGIVTSMLVKQTKSGEEYLTFVMDGYLVVIAAPVNTVTKAWLGGFSLSPIAQ